MLFQQVSIFIFLMDQNLFWILPFPLMHAQYNQQYPIYSNPCQPANPLLHYDSNQLTNSSELIVPPNINNPPANKKRKQFKRRTETQLNKCFKCPYDHCYKSYASDLALNLHMKNKHRGGSKKDRDRIARLILKSQMQGRPIPKSDIQLPPRYIQMNQVRLLLQTDDQNNEAVVKKEQ